MRTRNGDSGYNRIVLKLQLRKRRSIYILLGIVFVIFISSLGAVLYFGNQTIAKEEQRAKASAEQIAKSIAQLKAKKAAEEKKAKEAAEQKASSDAALESQLQGQVVTPKGCADTGAHSNPSSIDVVINKKRCFNPIDFAPSDLTSYNGYVVSAKIVPDLTALFTAAGNAGLPLSLTSSYRSYSNQVTTYNNWVAVNGSTAAADTVSARPGYSEHQTGFAVDIAAGNCNLECFRGSAHYTWMQAHAADYGFIERYPAGYESITGYSPESWHWRYVGPATAKSMKSKGIKTLEQLWSIPGGGY